MLKREIKVYFLLQYNIVKSNHPPIPNLGSLPNPFKYKASIHNNFRASRKLLLSPPNPRNHYLIQRKSSQRQPEKRTDTLYLWPRSKI